MLFWTLNCRGAVGVFLFVWFCYCCCVLFRFFFFLLSMDFTTTVLQCSTLASPLLFAPRYVVFFLFFARTKLACEDAIKNNIISRFTCLQVGGYRILVWWCYLLIVAGLQIGRYYMRTRSHRYLTPHDEICQTLLSWSLKHTYSILTFKHYS